MGQNPTKQSPNKKVMISGGFDDWTVWVAMREKEKTSLIRWTRKI